MADKADKAEELSTFLVSYPLYRRLTFEGIPVRWPDMLQLRCEHCGAERTFDGEEDKGLAYMNVRTPTGPLRAGGTDSLPTLVYLKYVCHVCALDSRSYFLAISYGSKVLRKVGQVPPWSLAVPPALDKLLGPDKTYYRRALTCMSQSYGLGACAYFRRVIENTMDDVLDRLKAVLEQEGGGEAAIKRLEEVQKKKLDWLPRFVLQVYAPVASTHS